MMTPLRNYVILEMIDESDTTESGLVISVKEKEPSKQGIVVAAGRGSMNPKNGEITPMTLKVGDKVLVNYGGTDVEYRGKKYKIIKEDDVDAIID